MKYEKKIGKFIIIVEREEEPDYESQYCRSRNCS